MFRIFKTLERTRMRGKALSDRILPDLPAGLYIVSKLSWSYGLYLEIHYNRKSVRMYYDETHLSYTNRVQFYADVLWNVMYLVEGDYVYHDLIYKSKVRYKILRPLIEEIKNRLKRLRAYREMRELIH